MKQNSMEKRFDEKFVDTQSQPKLSDWTITTNHARYVWDIKAFIKQEMEGLKMEKLIDKEFLGWGRQEFEDAIDTTDDAALLREFDTHNALVDKFNERINETN